MADWRPGRRTVFEAVLVCIILVLAVLLLLGRKPDKGMLKLVCYTPDEPITVTDLTAGSKTALPEPPVIDGYTFVGWRGEDGQIERREEITLLEDTYYSAVYSVSLDTENHIVFLDNVDGLFRPGDALTRREAAILFYRLMNTGTAGKGEFDDVSKEDECYLAAATLKDLGIVYGNYFHPDDKISRGEFFEILTSFFPASGTDAVFSDIDGRSIYYPAFCTAAENGWTESGSDVKADPFGEITRGETAVIVCKALKRPETVLGNAELAGTFLDVSQNSDYFAAAAEASIEHTFSSENGTETWTSAESLPKHEPGYFFVGVTLHCIDETGEPVIERSIDGLDFNERGEVTSGSEELDKYVRAFLKQALLKDGETDLDFKNQHAMLKEMFDYISYPTLFNYLSRNKYEPGNISWVTDEALTMLKTKKGNCYNFASVFYECARALGYDAKIFSGTMGTEYSPHAWVEIERNGMMYLYDVEDKYAHQDRNPYERDEDYMSRYHYHENGRQEESTSGGIQN